MVLLDEPTAALDPDVAIVVRKFILEQRKLHGVSIVITSHNMSEVSEVCDRVLVLRKWYLLLGMILLRSLAASVSKTRLHLISTQIEAIRMFALEQKSLQ